CLEGSTPSLSACLCVAESARGSANVRPAVFEAADEGSSPSPRTAKLPEPGDQICLSRGRQPPDTLTLKLLPDEFIPVSPPGLTRWWNGRHTALKTPRPRGHGSSTLPLVTAAVHELATDAYG